MIRLDTSEEDKSRLLATMKKYNEACNFVADRAFSLKLSNKYGLQKAVYRDIKHFGLTAQFAIRIIAKVVEAYKRDKTIKPVFRELGSIQYDRRNSRIGIDKVSIMTLQGRLKLATRIGDYQRVRFDRVKDQCDLLYRKGVFDLIAVVDAPEESEHDPVGTLGVDLGIENLGKIRIQHWMEEIKTEVISYTPASSLVAVTVDSPISALAKDVGIPVINNNCRRNYFIFRLKYSLE
jgi:putative transposase